MDKKFLILTILLSFSAFLSGSLIGAICHTQKQNDSPQYVEIGVELPAGDTKIHKPIQLSSNKGLNGFFNW